MIEVYSTNVTVTGAAPISWAMKPVQAGTTATLNQDGQTVNLNVPGVYEVTVNAFASTTAAGTVSFQLNGASEIARGTAQQYTAVGENGNICFSALIGVSATTASTDKAALTLDYTGDAGTISLVNMIVKKVL